MKIEKKDKYVAPLTVVTRIEVEESFCASADIVNPATGSPAKVEEHEKNENFGFSFGDNADWDQ